MGGRKAEVGRYLTPKYGNPSIVTDLNGIHAGSGPAGRVAVARAKYGTWE